jgi:kinesin family member C1
MRPITMVPLQGIKGAIKQLRLGLQNRTVSATGMNDRSSRAHTIFQLNLLLANKPGTEGTAIRSSTLTFVDLAGSERMAQEKTAGINTYVHQLFSLHLDAQLLSKSPKCSQPL